MKTQDVALKISGKKDICCAGCEEGTISSTLGQMPGISKVNSNFESFEVKVILDPNLTSVVKVQESLKQIGWQSQEISA